MNEPGVWDGFKPAYDVSIGLGDDVKHLHVKYLMPL